MTKKPEAQVTAKQATTPQSAPKQRTGDCSSELSKYDWHQGDAYKIMFQESSNDPSKINNNPATGDYSVGCMQINLIGAMRATRPAESWLLLPENNVKYAYQMYVAQGRTFCKTSGWYNSCKATGVL